MHRGEHDGTQRYLTFLPVHLKRQQNPHGPKQTSKSSPIWLPLRFAKLGQYEVVRAFGNEGIDKLVEDSKHRAHEPESRTETEKRNSPPQKAGGGRD